jgi:hypothetical protein
VVVILLIPLASSSIYAQTSQFQQQPQQRSLHQPQTQQAAPQFPLFTDPHTGKKILYPPDLTPTPCASPIGHLFCFKANGSNVAWFSDSPAISQDPVQNIQSLAPKLGITIDSIIPETSIGLPYVTFTYTDQNGVQFLGNMVVENGVGYAVKFLTSEFSSPRLSHDLNKMAASLESPSQTSAVVPSQSSSTTATITKSNFLTYTNSTYGLKIQYPSTWHFNLPQFNRIVSFGSPTLLDGVDIQRFKSPPGINLAQETNTAINLLNKTGFNVISSTPTTLAGNNPAERIEYTTKQGQIDLKLMQVFTIKGYAGLYYKYIITFATTKDQFLNDLPTVQKMIDSFQIISK